MAIKYTTDQQKVIDVRNKNVLVAAAAGSGKTAVLVERIIQKITDSEHPVDIDKMLVVTFTNAAAAQMRERIYQAIVKKQEEDADNENLARQAALVHTAQITTIHSFCLFLLHNHFQEIGLDPAFRIGDEGEVSLLREETMEELLEEAFEKRDADFIYCKNCFAPRVKDTALSNAILQLYHFAMSYPWPVKWLEGCKRSYQVTDLSELEKSPWMQLCFDYVRQYLLEDQKLIEEMLRLCDSSDGPYMYGENIESDQQILATLLQKDSYDSLYRGFSEYKFSTLSRKKDETVSEAKRERVKQLRGLLKDDLKRCKEQFFFQTPEQNLERMQKSGRAITTLIDLTVQFMERFAQKKQEKNLIDFSDMEHLALAILLRGEDETPTETAISYRDYFEEIMIDEYQDSNLVQELLLCSISKEQENAPNNRFMVGDIKQSIYKFRLARPEIFLEKYNDYQTEDGQDGIRIDLHQNFRSRREVVESVNAIFGRIMRESVGGVSYDEKAALYLGAVYPEASCETVDWETGIAGNPYETELLLYEKVPQEETVGGLENFNIREKEATMIGNRIREMVGHFPVTDEKTGKLRPAKYKDIVILLRTNKNWDDAFKKVLTMQGIPVHASSKTGYFAADEIQTMMNFLRVINNPYDDIALASVMTSGLGRMTAVEMARVRIQDKECPLWENLQTYAEAQEAHPEEKSDGHIEELVERIELFREYADYMGIYELLCEIFRVYHYVEYVSALPGGEQRKANVSMLLEKAVSYEKSSFHGLYSFIHYMEKLQKYEMDFGEADTTEEEADTVRLMSIHKSKGLEFPICFVAGMGKQINMMDSRASILLDVDLGLATDYVDGDRRVKMKSMCKSIFAEKMKRDSLGEELRVLYVALTRAKEKLLLCGAVDHYEEDTPQDREQAKAEEIPFSKLLTMKSQLAYVLEALKAYDKCVRVYRMQELFIAETKQEITRQYLLDKLEGTTASDERKRLTKVLQERFAYQYPYDYLKNLYTKTSVSELKKAHIHEDAETAVVFETDQVEQPYLPQFCREEEKSSGVSRGSAYHRVLELLDYEQMFALYEKDGTMEFARAEQFVKEQMDTLSSSGKVADIELVDFKRIGTFVTSRACYRMARAASFGKLYREQPFVMAISANRILPEVPETEKVLIQGIIDVFFYEKNEESGVDEVIVLDYKTDRVRTGQELVDRYKTQLDYYGEALSKLTGKRVAQKLIYSFALAAEIPV